MARFRAEEANNYGGQGGGGFFSIANDREVKQVRFMYDTADDVEGMSVHKVTVGDKDRYVNCLRAYNEPVDTCPFCREHKPVQARLFIPVYNIEEDAVQIWDRGKTMFAKMSSLCSRYATKDNLVSTIFEVERNGKLNDQKTTYEIYKVDTDNTQLADLPEAPTILGGLVLDKTAEDMEYYLEEGSFPPEEDEDNSNAGTVSRRRSDSGRGGRAETRTPSRQAERRTPANNSRRRNEDTF